MSWVNPYIGGITGTIVLTVPTTKNEANTSKTGDPGFAVFGSSNFGTFHPHQGKNGTEEAQTDGRNHQSPACLDVSWKNKTHNSRHRQGLRIANQSVLPLMSFFCIPSATTSSYRRYTRMHKVYSCTGDKFTHKAQGQFVSNNHNCLKGSHAVVETVLAWNVRFGRELRGKY